MAIPWLLFYINVSRVVCIKKGRCAGRLYSVLLIVFAVIDKAV
jgi:hypothetical protein